MDRVKLDYSKVLSFVGEEEIAVQREKATKALKDLEDGTCKGVTFWVGSICPFTSRMMNWIVFLLVPTS